VKSGGGDGLVRRIEHGGHGGLRWWFWALASTREREGVGFGRVKWMQGNDTGSGAIQKGARSGEERGSRGEMRLAVSAPRRIEREWLWEEGDDRQARPVNGWERGWKRRPAGWALAQEEKGGGTGCAGLAGRKRGNGGFSFFLFSKSIFQTFSNLDLNQISFVNSTHHINKYCSMNASTIFLSLY